MFKNIRLVFFATLIAVGAGAVWWIQFGKSSAPQVFATELRLPQLPQNDQVTQSIQSLDSQLAQWIRKPDISQFSLPNAVTQLGTATVSATFATTPAEFWQDFRQKGAQAAVGSVVSQAQVQAGEVSADILNEARYQYCKGVVTTYESSVKTSSP